MVDLQKISISSDVFRKLPDRLRYNETISGFYKTLSEEKDNDETLGKISSRVKGCSLIWDLLTFKNAKVKFLEGFNRCKDKFCANCQAAVALKRAHKFTPVFQQFEKDNNVYHCIFTVKNCTGSLLGLTIKQMYKAFSYLIRYLDSRSKVKDCSFSFLGFKAAIKALEVTYNKELDTYHPHLHCLFAFSKELELEKKYLNVFSYSNAHSDVRYFSLIEIFFQKIWYLLNNNIKVTLDNIDSLELGYSVVFNKAKPEDYKEVFKYALKNDLNRDKCLDYERFKVYQKHLKGVRFIQGYGEVLNYDFEDDTLSDEELDLCYEELRAELFDEEEPLLSHEEALSILDDMAKGDYSYVTKGSIKQFVLSGENY